MIEFGPVVKTFGAKTVESDFLLEISRLLSDLVK
jgi:hypothetical protein